ncbi:MAG: hypothetical protein ABFD54_00445 [Armatimonadota bacterium]|nr:hypothetical protein [bacterium]
MTTRPKVGLLPFYLALYDRVAPEERPRIDQFAGTIAKELEKRGLEVELAPVCRLKDEFASAVSLFEKTSADAIVTLHMAYSPSLESAKVLAGTNLPILVLDTSPTFEFGPEQDPAEIMHNHGIHGVQDMCNLLIRNGKSFQIEAGHWEHSDVIDRIAVWARAAQLASRMRSARVGRIAEPFQGMGDFAVPPDVLHETMGVETVPADFAMLRSLLPAEDDPDVIAEMESDLARFSTNNLDMDVHRKSVRSSLAVRRWMEREHLTAFTMNFDSIDRSSGLAALPFLEASKAMARGQGYAGEGDVLTAALVGTLASAYPETTFTEMFCADWAGDRIFLSHMGELNPDLVAGKAELVEKPMPFLNTDAPALVVGRLKGGDAVFVNLAPGSENTFTLILVPIKMLGEGRENMPATVRGWFKPPMPVSDFLAAYSSVGGTHHAAIVYKNVIDDLIRFGELMGWDVVVLE